MVRVSTGVGLCLLGSVVACRARSEVTSAQKPAGYEHAFAMPDCAPWDALALTVYLTPNPVQHEPVAPPFLRVSVYQSPTTVSGRTFR